MNASARSTGETLLTAAKGSAPVRTAAASVDAAAIRQTAEAPFREAKQAVDLTQAERIVSVGRGIKAPENIDLAKQLAAALNAELAASRPICDSGWLPMDRQVGSSGQTVAPKLYFAIGISGAIQHLVGMKGSKTIVAVNKDAEAPIFSVANNFAKTDPALRALAGRKIDHPMADLKKARGMVDGLPRGDSVRE